MTDNAIAVAGALDSVHKYPPPVPILSAEDEEFYYPSNFITGQFSSEDIPSPETYRARMGQIGASSPGSSPSSVKPVLPNTTVPSWSGMDDSTCDPTDWVYNMVHSDIEEVERALRNIPGKCDDLFV